MIWVREVDNRDFAGIQRIHRSCDDPWREADECAAWLNKRLERGFYIRVAGIGEQVLGHGEWIVTDSPQGKFLYLGMLQVDAAFQRRGIGRAMLADGARYAREQGCGRVVTSPENDDDGASLAFYEKCGFVAGRKILSAALPTGSYGYTKSYFPREGAPFRVVREREYVFGVGQASARHMWEVYNEKPVTDDRNVKTLLADDGDCIQLGWFPGQDTALALCWSNTPNRNTVSDILAFGRSLGLQQVTFLFFEEYQPLLDGFNAEISVSDLEIYKPI
ncbi:MAG: GNAT family N-acetyltransferase [Firmicutes bacterium]|nr:GNAT family N-acetyltransferase [Bacillota bacterium]